MLAQVRDMCLEARFPRSELPFIDLCLAYERARAGDYAGALPQMRKSVEEMSIRRQFSYQVGAAALLVEMLLGRATEGDLVEAEAAVDRLAAIPGHNWVARDIMVLRLRTLLAKAHGDDAGYREFRDRYRALATSLGFAGHMQWAEAMP
jgi:adenylate cyclase